MFLLIIIIFQLRTAAFKAYCAIWVRRSNFRHQASPRVSPCESTQRRKVELWARNVRYILPKCRLTRYIYGSFTCRKATTWDRRLYFPSKGRPAEDFFALKIRRLRRGANPRTWVPKASTLPLDHRSHYVSAHPRMKIWLPLPDDCVPTSQKANAHLPPFPARRSVFHVVHLSALPEKFRFSVNWYKFSWMPKPINMVLVLDKLHAQNSRTKASVWYVSRLSLTLSLCIFSHS